MTPLATPLRGVALNKLFVLINGEGDGDSIRSNYRSSRANPRSPGEIENWVFGVESRDISAVLERENPRAIASLYCQLEDGSYLVSKAKLMELLPEEERRPRNWRQVLRLLVPGCRLVAEGHNALAVRFADQEIAKE